MTDKQLALLQKHLTENSIKKLQRVDSRNVSSLIDTIIKTSNIEMSIKIESDKLLPLEKSTIEGYINSHIEEYSKIKDEYATITHVFNLLDERYYRLEQYWFKGESSSRSYNWFFVGEDYKLYNRTVYDIMVDKGIYTMQGLFDLILDR